MLQEVIENFIKKLNRTKKLNNVPPAPEQRKGTR